MKNKKANTALFMVIATILNVVLMLLFLTIGFVLLAAFGSGDDSNGQVVWTMIIFIGSLALSWTLYALMVKAYSKRVDMDETFAPISFKGKKSKKPSQGSDNMSSMKG